jgi:hypothetical protein
VPTTTVVCGRCRAPFAVPQGGPGPFKCPRCGTPVALPAAVARNPVPATAAGRASPAPPASRSSLPRRLLREEASGARLSPSDVVEPSPARLRLLPALRIAAWSLCGLFTLLTLGCFSLDWGAQDSSIKQAAVAAQTAAWVVGFYVLARAATAVIDAVDSL